MNEHPIPEDRHDAALECVLHALGSAPVPEGLELRIATGLHARVATRQNDRVASHTWWRGAATGAASATLAIGAVVLLLHRSQIHTPHTADSITAAKPAITFATGHPARDEVAASPCAAPPGPIVRLALMHAPSAGRVEHVGRSRPFAAAPLTAAERSLVLLARRADPKDLAILDPEVRAKLDAEEAAEFAEFFPAPPPAPPPLPTADTQPN